tara:strand:+ start:18387 stop:18596 length:210 start_codon:yes stop_codon:yes gene_type:complete
MTTLMGVRTEMIENKDKPKYFEWLTDTRDSGRINMMQAPSEMSFEFGITKSQARQIFIEWCEELRKEDE